MGMILGIGRIREKVDSLLRLAFGLLTVLAMLLPAAAKAQTSYPVQVNVMVTPPNSVYLTDYYARGSEKLKVQLLLKEVDRPSFPVKLRFKIEGSALRLTSRPGVNLPPFTLQGGVMVEAAGDLLAPYLSLNALVAEGADASSFQGKGLRMADGFYKVEVWAEEMGRSVRVSNIATTFISTMLYQSPVITSPIDKAILPDQGIQNIIFQWMPRHLGASLDVTQSTYYKVRLVEVWPRERDPQEAIRSSKPLYEGLSNSTTFVYGAGQPTLISGRRYALQVQAQDADQRDLFVGQGYSNVVCFTYGEECQAPQGLKVEVNGPNNANALWTSNPRNTGYTFAYRKVYGLDTAWVEQPMGIASYSLSGLTPVTSYQARVSATCGLSKSIWSQPRAFTTADRPEIKFECGKNPNIPTITDRTLYPNLKDGDRISAADFKVEILTVSLGSRGYSGSGIARIPFLRNAPAFCSFKDVKVNKDLQLYEGALVLADSVTVIDKKKVDEAVRLGKDVINSLKDKNPNTTVIVAPVSGTVTAVNITTSSSGDATTMTGGTSTVAVTTSTGQTVTSTPGTNTKVVDESGNVVAISKNGTATQGKYDKNAFGQGATNSEVAQAATDDKLPKVTLTLDTSKPYYGYDTSAGGEPWVSIQTGKSVSLTASVDLRHSSHKATDIRYRTNDGMVVDATGSNPATLTAKGLYSGTAIPILAVADTGKVDSLKTSFVCGKINTVGYDPEYRRVWLVPVNGAKVDKEAIAKKLSAVYRQAVVEWDVQCDPKTMSLTLTDEELKGICKNITVGIASNYTIEQQAVLKKFGREPEERSYILFMVDGKAGDATGFMPLNRSAGFIYLQGQSTDAVARTVAHELGHGAFGLAHEGRAKDNTLAATDNLMDYSGGIALTKAQWDAIHSEYRRLKWFQDKEEGKDIKPVDLHLAWIPIKNKGTYTFMSPAGLPITVVNPTEVLVNAGTPENNVNIILKRLPEFVYSFKVEGKTYGSKLDRTISEKSTGGIIIEEHCFKGYCDSLNTFYVDNLSAKLQKLEVWLYDGTKKGQDFPFRKYDCSYTVSDYMGTSEGAYYNPNEKYYAAGPIALRWDEDIAKKKGGWYYLSYDEKDLELFRKAPVLWVAITNNPMALGGERIHIADYIPSSGLGLSVRIPNLPRRLWDCQDPNYVFPSQIDSGKESLAFLCGIIDGVINTGNSIGDLCDIIFTEKGRNEFQTSLGNLLSPKGIKQLGLETLDAQLTNPNKCYVAYNNGKLLLDLASTIYGGVVLAKNITKVGGLVNYLRLTAENLTAIPKLSLSNLKKANIKKLTSLGYAFKKTTAEAYIYYTLNGSIKRFANFAADGALVPLSFTDNFEGLTKVASLDDITYLKNTATHRGSLDIYKTKDGSFKVGVKMNGDDLGGITFDRLTYIKSKLPEKFKSYADEVEAAAKALGTKQDELDNLTTMLGCFTATTSVQTAHGAVPIASVTEADQVLSYNHQAGKTELKRIFNIKRHVVKGLLLLGLSTGQTVEATPNHPFYVGGSYREAATLHVGDTLKAANGSAVILQSVARKDSLAAVYNFTVADNLNYFVGEPGVLVHNSCLMESMVSLDKLTKAVDKLSDVAKGRYMRMYKDVDKEILGVLNSEPNIEKLLLHLTSDESVGIVGLSEIIKSSKANAEIVVDSWKKAEALGCKLKKKGFPSNSKRPDVYIAAKEYQKKFSRHADLSFEFNGISFDAIENGKLIDAKLGYGKSTFKDAIGDIDDVDNFAPEVINEVLSESLVASARRQLNAVKGTSQQIEWYVSSDLAKRGIEKLLNSRDLKGITITVKAP